MSPNGTRYPSTPTNQNAIRIMNELEAKVSIKKSSVPKSPIKCPVSQASPQVSQASPKVSKEFPEDPKVPEEAQREALNWYHKRLEEMKTEIEMLETVIEDNEGRHRHEIEEQEREREALKNDPVANSNLREQLRMAQMELGFKDREIELAAREHAAASVDKKSAADSDEDLAVIFSSGSISGPDADVILDLANIRGLEPKLYNERHQIGTLMSLYETTVAHLRLFRKLSLQ